MIAWTPVVLAVPSGEGAKAGPWGLAVILLLCAACYFLFKSMSKHMRRVREQFPADGPPPATPGKQESSAEDPARTRSETPGGQGDQPGGALEDKTE